MLLYRPTGLKELELVYATQMQEWPPRLPEQPIFYPVLNFGYAAQIARDWNTKSSQFAGYVTRFEVEDSYVSRFERQVVGRQEHEELWVPAEELDEFNRHIVGRIELVAAFFGPQFTGYLPQQGRLREHPAAEQFALLAGCDKAAVAEEMAINNLAIFLHYLYWRQADFNSPNLEPLHRDITLNRIREVWQEQFPQLALPLGEPL